MNTPAAHAFEIRTRVTAPFSSYPCLNLRESQFGSTMAPLLHRQPFKVFYLLCFFAFMVFIQLPCWLVYYSWRPNRPRKNWTLYRTINLRILRKLTQLPLRTGILTNRDLSLEVPQEELGSFSSRFVWIPELETEDIVGMVAEHAARVGVKSIAIPAYWILKDGAKWSPVYDKARKDEKVILYLHGGAFMVCFCRPSHPFSELTSVVDGYCTPISSDSICSQGDTQIFHVSLPSVVGRLSAQFRASPRMGEPIPNCDHRCNCSVQVPRLRGWIPPSEHHCSG